MYLVSVVPVVSVVCGRSCNDLRILSRPSLEVVVMSFIRLALLCFSQEITFPRLEVATET